MHKNSSGDQAYIPCPTHLLQRCYTRTSNMLRRVQRKDEARRVHPSSQEIFMHAKMLCVFFLPKRIWGHSDFYFLCATFDLRV